MDIIERIQYGALTMFAGWSAWATKSILKKPDEEKVNRMIDHKTELYCRESEHTREEMRELKSELKEFRGTLTEIRIENAKK